MFHSIKNSLRIKSDSFDDEIFELIDAAERDLEMSGIRRDIINTNDPLIFQAVKTYCKAHVGLDNKDSEKYQKAYDSLKEHLALCSDYNEVKA
jgi:hypothetical protein